MASVRFVIEDVTQLMMLLGAMEYYVKHCEVGDAEDTLVWRGLRKRLMDAIECSGENYG